jgi:membrane protein YqaA with SNARE-associated domain
MDWLPAHFSLFSAAFLSATVLPGSSEIVLVMLTLQRPDDWPTLFLAATIGNTLGSLTNWILGRWFSGLSGRRWFPASQQQLDKASSWFGKYGTWSLLLAWLPIIGDALTIVAGILRVDLWIFIALVGSGKALRYAVVLFGSDLWRALI